MELVAQKREVFGRAVRQLRTQGIIPAELYGHGLENIHLSIREKEFLGVFKEAGENTVVTVVVGGEKLPVLIYDVERHPISEAIISVDFYQVRMDEKIKATIPLEFIGIAPVVKEAIGVLVKSMHEVEVEALPADLPHEIVVDLGVLTELGKSIYVKDLPIPANAKIMVDPETVVVSVTEKVSEEEEKAAQEAAVTASVEQVAVETEEKKAERDVKKAASGSVSAEEEKEVKQGK
ncbi:MAG: 50S ribosomal protein L25 [bacterium]|nr:50S ribosomal protein L25 [bacterium]